MKTGNVRSSDESSGDPGRGAGTPAIRLLLIPVLVYSAWLLESFLLEGSSHLFQRPESPGLFLYTFVACILTGMIAPLICIHKAFITGAVNMFQIGFRSLRRTMIVCFLTGIFCSAAFVVMNPFGADKLAFAQVFLLVLPTAIASVMICWVLIGTHVQAFVRRGGALVSISVGIAATTLLFGLTPLAHSIFVREQDTFFWSVCSGMVIAFFFFAVRDIYATSIVAAECTAFLSAGRISPVNLQGMFPALFLSSVFAITALFGIHWYLSRHYATVVVPVMK